MRKSNDEVKNFRRSSLTFNQEQAILYLYKQHVTAKKAAEYFNFTSAAVHYHYRKFKRAGVKKKLIKDILKEGNIL